MERAVNKRYTTFTKHKGDLFQKMMAQAQSGESIDIFGEDVAEQPAPSKPKQLLPLTPEGDKVWKSGTFKKQYKGVFGKIWKTHFWVLDGKNLICYPEQGAQIPLKKYPLADLRSIVSKPGKDGKEDYSSVVMMLKSDRKLPLMAMETETLLTWLLAIDSVQSYLQIEESILNPLSKHRLLSAKWKEGFRGGEISSSYDEEWTYTAQGLLTSSVGVDPPLSYRWDGEMLIGVDDVSTQLGSGKWNGLSLVWFDEAANGMLSLPSVRFTWQEEDREYHDDAAAAQVWKWTRHFLASKFGAGEWIVEGSVPEPVVMLLQMMRTSRLSRLV